MSVRTFIDTDVLVYLFDQDAPEKQAVARSILQSHGLDRELVLSTQVLQEFYVTATRKLDRALPTANAHEAVRDFAALPVVQIDTDMVLRSVELSRRHQVSLWDALIIEAAVAGACSHLLSEDLQDGWNIQGLRVENPFRRL